MQDWHFRAAVRILLKSKIYTCINVVGLALGITCCLLIVFYVRDEMNFDGFHIKADRICRVTSEVTHKGMGVTRSATTPARLAPTLLTILPEIATTVRLYPKSSLVVRDDVRTEFQEDRFFYTDPGFFDVFSFRLVDGNPADVLNTPFSVVITQSTARRYYGTEPAVGEVINIDGKFDCRITGIVQDPPINSHIQFDFLASFATAVSMEPWIENWQWPPMYTYLLLAEGRDITEIQTRMPVSIAGHLPSNLRERVRFEVQSLRNIHLHSHLERELTPNSDITYVYVFSIIALSILLIASINFISMSTARSAPRALEVGIHKTFGARRIQLTRQFLCESILVVALAMGLALALVEVMLPTFNSLSQKQVGWQDLGYTTIFLISIVIIIGVGVLAGSYPALHLSRFEPGRAEKGISFTLHVRSARLRKWLVIFQFTISSILIIGTLIVFKQLDYLRNARLGFDKEAMVIVPLREIDNQRAHKVLKQKFIEGAGVISVTGSSGVPSQIGPDGFFVFPAAVRDDSLEIPTLTVDADFVKTYKIDLLAGRDFSEHHASDANEAFLVNEAAARKLGWARPIDKELTLRYWRDRWIRKKGRIIGLVKDFHYQSLHRSIEPILFHIDAIEESYYYAYLSVRISSSDVQNVMRFLARKWKEFNPNRPLEFSFLDERLSELYHAEERQARILSAFAVIAISIACLGLISLTAFSTEQRTKEVGVRKVLGASTVDIALLLARDFLILVAIANLLAIPVAYYIVKPWLEVFPYRIVISVSPFLGGALISFTIAVVTVTFHTLKTARANPVRALRYE